MPIKERKIRIFDYGWHLPHQLDMIYALKSHCDFFFCLTSKVQWPLEYITITPELNFVTHYESGKYDIAILHVDQHSILPGHLKRRIYDEFNDLINDIPKIVINHGSPVCPEGFGVSLTEEEMRQACVSAMKRIVGKNPMVVNSHTAAGEKEWGFGTPIVHGISIENWRDLAKEPRVFTAISAKGMDTYYNRQCLEQVKHLLNVEYGHTLWHAKINVPTGSSRDNYKNFLGSSLLYLDTSIHTPMNRARTEAMLSGCCVIQIEGAHDLELWAKHNENIVLVPNNPETVAATVAWYLDKGYQKAISIGKSGKNMASEMASPERYKNDWINLLQQII